MEVENNQPIQDVYFECRRMKVIESLIHKYQYNNFMGKLHETRIFALHEDYEIYFLDVINIVKLGLQHIQTRLRSIYE